MTDTDEVETLARLLEERPGWHRHGAAAMLRRQQTEIERLRAEISAGEVSICGVIGELEAALKQCADELSEWIEANYIITKDYPDGERRYERDMTTVIRARELLK